MPHDNELADLFTHLASDRRMTVAHFRLYVTLFQYAHLLHPMYPAAVPQRLVMKIAGISDPDRYQQCLQELAELGYLRAIASPEPWVDTLIFLNDCPSSSPALDPAERFQRNP